MLAGDRIVFPEFQLFGLRSRVFLCDVVIAGIYGTQQLDDDRICFGHSISPEKQDLKICGKLTGSGQPVKDLVRCGAVISTLRDCGTAVFERAVIERFMFQQVFGDFPVFFGFFAGRRALFAGKCGVGTDRMAR